MTVVKLIGAAWTATQEGEAPEKGEYIFSADPALEEYDWLVVYDEFPRRKKYPGLEHGIYRLSCPPANTILATQEPVSVKSYNRVYVQQFGHLLTNRPYEAERHHHWHFGRGYYAWFIDRSYPEVRAFVMPEKTKTISAVYSAKRMRHTKHHARAQLLDYLMEHIHGLDRFGKGVRRVAHKQEALDAYKYHLAIENHIAPGHWSEKIGDAFLCGCLPFYAGDPDLDKILPKDSFIPIPIDDPPAAAEIINNAIASGEYEKRIDAIGRARELILDKYNYRDQIIEVIESAKNDTRQYPRFKPFLMTRRKTRMTFTGATSDLASHIAKFFRAFSANVNS